MTPIRSRLLAGAMGLALAACALPAFSQSDDLPTKPVSPPLPSEAAAAPAPVPWDQKRLERLERNMRRIESELSRLKPDKAPPVLIEPDPEVTALQGRVDELSQHVSDVEGALKRVNGQLDAQGLALETLKRDDAAAHEEIDALKAHVTQLEAQLKAMTAPPPAAPGPGAAGPSPGPGGNLEAGAPQGDPSQAFGQAMQMMRDGDYSGASKAFQDYLAGWPDGPDAPEAHYRLAETYYVDNAQKPAAEQYALALKGWPKSAWAPDAAVKLALTLQALGRSPDACGALGEFQKRYAASAAPSVKARATALEARAKCKAPAPAPAAHHRRRKAD